MRSCTRKFGSDGSKDDETGADADGVAGEAETREGAVPRRVERHRRAARLRQAIVLGLGTRVQAVLSWIHRDSTPIDGT